MSTKIRGQERRSPIREALTLTRTRRPVKRLKMRGLFSLPLISYKNRLPRRGTGGGEKHLHKISQDHTVVPNFTQSFTSLPSPSQGIHPF